MSLCPRNSTRTRRRACLSWASPGRSNRPMGASMKLTTLVSALVLLVAAGCQSVLDVTPVNEFPEADAIVNAATARAAVAGMYDALQSTSYYGGALVFFGDRPRK